MTRRDLFRSLFGSAFLLLAGRAAARDEHWILIDTEAQFLEVYRGEETVLSFRDIALGRAGAAEDRIRGDNRTPLGDFRIAWINTNSRFHIFLGFDYPTFHHARRAYSRGRLPLDEFLDLAEAYRDRRLPPQTTSIGGHIGIHGLGSADPELHRRSNWTRGCVAVTDDEIEQLMAYVDVGTRVFVQ